jgi:hypothetical protein
MYVQFSDSTEATIIAYAASAQPSDAWPYQGTVDSSDARWATYYAKIPAIAQEFLPATTS